MEVADITTFNALHGVLNRSHRQFGGSFPANIDKFERLQSREISGASRPFLIRDGNKSYVFKEEKFCPSSSDRFNSSRNEVIADNFYRAMGVPVSSTRLYSGGGLEGRASRFIDGSVPYDRWVDTASPTQRRAVHEALAKNSHVDYLVGNMDLGGNNIVIDRNNIPYRIDNGISLLALMHDTVPRKNDLSDLWYAMRYPHTAGYYWNLVSPEYAGKDRLVRILRKIRDTDWTPGLKAVPKEYQQFLKKRIDLATEAADMTDRGYSKGTLNLLLDELLMPDKEQREQASKDFKAFLDRRLKLQKMYGFTYS